MDLTDLCPITSLCHNQCQVAAFGLFPEFIRNFRFISHASRGSTCPKIGHGFNEGCEHIPKITQDTFPSFRYFFCSAAIEAGYSINEVVNQAGHSNIHTTLLYTNPTREKMKEEANLL